MLVPISISIFEYLPGYIYVNSTCITDYTLLLGIPIGLEIRPSKIEKKGVTLNIVWRISMKKLITE